MCSHFNIEDGRKKQHFWYIMLYYFEKGKNAAEMHKKMQRMEEWGNEYADWTRCDLAKNKEIYPHLKAS